MGSAKRPAGHDWLFEFPAETDQLASLRRLIASAIREAGADPDVIEQFELVVGELATNVMQHSTATDVSVILRSSPDRWTLEMADPPTELLAPILPAQVRFDGRGLFIAHTVMDDVELTEHDGRPWIRCTKFRSSAEASGETAD